MGAPEPEPEQVYDNAGELPMPEQDDGGAALAPIVPTEADEMSGPEGDGA